MLPLVCIQTLNREPCDNTSQLQRVLLVTDVFGLERMVWAISLAFSPG